MRRFATVGLAIIGLMLSLVTAVGLLVGLGNRTFIASSIANEKLLTLLCIFYIMVLVAKCASELLLACGAYKQSANEMWAGLMINKITVGLMVFGLSGCALMRDSVAMAVASYAGVLIVLSICIWLCTFKAYKIVASLQEPLLPLEQDDHNCSIGIENMVMHV